MPAQTLIYYAKININSKVGLRLGKGKSVTHLPLEEYTDSCGVVASFTSGQSHVMQSTIKCKPHHKHQTFAHSPMEVTFFVTDMRFSPVSLHSCPSTMQSEMGRQWLGLTNKTRKRRNIPGKTDFLRMGGILGWWSVNDGNIDPQISSLDTGRTISGSTY